MKLITLNTWGKSGPYEERWAVFFGELKNLKPDVLCLQEVFEDELAKKLAKTFGYAHSALDDKAGLLIISHLPLTDIKALTYQCRSAQEMNYERKALIATLETGGKKITLANTHLAWRAEDRPIRKNQVAELLEGVKQRRLPSMICGDFNDIPGSSVLELTRLAGYTNLIEISEPETITWDNRNPFIQSHSVKFPDRQVDYILVHELTSGILIPTSCRLAFNQPNQKLIYASDHYGLAAKFKIEGK